MKKYIKPLAEVKEFKSTDKIAALDNFFIGHQSTGIDADSNNITSYYAGS